MRGLTKTEQASLNHGISVVEDGRGKVDYVLVLLGSDLNSTRLDVRGPAKKEMVELLKKAITRLEEEV